MDTRASKKNDVGAATKDTPAFEVVEGIRFDTFIPPPPLRQPRGSKPSNEDVKILLKMKPNQSYLFTQYKKSTQVSYAPANLWDYCERVIAAKQDEEAVKDARYMLGYWRFASRLWTQFEQLTAEQKNASEADKKVILGARVWRLVDRTPEEAEVHEKAKTEARERRRLREAEEKAKTEKEAANAAE